MPRVAKPFKLDLAKIKEDFKTGKFPYKIPCSSCKTLCGNSSIDIFNKRIATYGSIDKLYANYVCTKCRKTKKIVPIREVTKAQNTEVNEKGEQICKAALARMETGGLDYFWRHKYFSLPAECRTMIDTRDGYVTYVLTAEGEKYLKQKD